MLRDEDHEVIEQLSHYSHRIYLTGGIVATRAQNPSIATRVVDLIVRIDDLDAFTGENGIAALSQLYGPVSSHGRRLTLTNQGTFYRIENLAPDEFQSRFEEIVNGEDGQLNFKTLCHDLSTNTIVDKFKVLHDRRLNSIRKIRPQDLSQISAASLKDVIAGKKAYHYFQLEAGEEFEAFANRTLSLAASSPQEAAAVVKLTLQNIAPLSEVLTAEEIRALLESRLVSTSFALQDGRSTSRMADALEELIRRYGDSYTTAAMWLAIAIGSADEQHGYAYQSMFNQDGLAATKTRRALKGALEILRQSPWIDEPPKLEDRTVAAWQSETRPDGPTFPSSELSDLDRDSVPSLIEYGLGMDPSQPSPSGLPSIESTVIDGKGCIALHYHRDSAKTDLLYEVQTSTNLRGNWTTQGVVDEPAEQFSSTGTLEPRRAYVPQSSERTRYLRLKISRRLQ